MLDDVESLASTVAESEAEDYELDDPSPKRRRIVTSHIAETTTWRSPVRLISAPDLPESENCGCVNLSDVIGHEDIDKLYSFNMMHDLQFLRGALHRNVPLLSKDRSVTIVEGENGGSRMQASIMPEGNLFHVIGVKLPHWGTHHSKLLVFFRKNGTICQFAITTANLIEIDWRVLTNAVYISPEMHKSSTSCPFQEDLVRYISAYNVPELRDLAQTLAKYDFSEVRGTLIASVPGKFGPNTALWGAERLAEVLGRLCSKYDEDDIVWAQVSSLGRFTGDYLDWFFKLLAIRAQSPTTPFSRRALKSWLVWPTEINIQESLQGYQSGGSIHFDGNGKGGSDQKKLLRSVLAQWKGIKSGRDRLAPHIKVDTNDLINLLTIADLRKSVQGSHSTIMVSAYFCQLVETSMGGVGRPRSGIVWFQNQEL